jgi:methylmalonyl-CoA carboxyltransferase small subunit
VKLKVTIDGKVYEVEVEATEPEQHRPDVPMPAPASRIRSGAPVASSLGSTLNASPAADESKVCRSPVAGVVVKVAAQVGQAIQANDVLMVLEAMKMETSITSPVSGKVAKVNAAVGDPVQSGQVLVEFE